jgi:hypothetical protein
MAAYTLKQKPEFDDRYHVKKSREKVKEPLKDKASMETKEWGKSWAETAMEELEKSAQTQKKY